MNAQCLRCGGVTGPDHECLRDDVAALPEAPDLSGWDFLRGPVAWAYNVLREEPYR